MKKTQTVTLFIADDHSIYRKGLVSLLSDEPTIRVIGEAANGEELLKRIKTQQPDIVLMDLEMPVMNGFEALRQITVTYPEVKVIINSTHYSEYFVAQLAQLGARAYLSKSASEHIVSTIHKVHRDGFYFSKKVSGLIVEDALQEKKFQLLLQPLALTEREAEVLRHICAEKANREIAPLLGVTIDTVEFHRKNIYKKTQASSVIGLVKYAIKHGLADLDPLETLSFK